MNLELADVENWMDTRDHASGWPDDWYVYDGGQVKGPLSASETFALAHEDPRGKPCLVSRKGFMQWYALQDLSALFNLTAAMGQRVAHAKAAVSPRPKPPQALAVLGRDERRAQETQARPPADGLPEHLHPSRPFQSQRVEKGHVTPRPSASLVHPVDANRAVFLPAQASSPPVRPTPADQDFAPDDGLLPSEIDEGKAAATAQARASAGMPSLMRDYIASKARLRLGQLREPWIAGLVGLPLSLGVYWILWFRDLAQELQNHRSGPVRGNPPPFWWAAIPIVHVYMTFRLAQELLSLEQENRYQSTDPWLAAFLALLPPLALIYLQREANKHWLLHVRHAKTEL